MPKTTSKKKAAKKSTAKKKAPKKKSAKPAKKKTTKKKSTKATSKSKSKKKAPAKKKSSVAKKVAYTIGDFIGVNDGYTFLTGKDIASGKNASRLKAAGWLLVGLIPVGKVGKGFKIVKLGTKGSRAAKVAAKSSKVVSKKAGKKATKYVTKKATKKAVKKKVAKKAVRRTAKKKVTKKAVKKTTKKAVKKKAPKPYKNGKIAKKSGRPKAGKKVKPTAKKVTKKTVKKGKLIGKLAGLTKEEKKAVEILRSRGKNVEIIPVDPKAKIKTPDFKINGVKTELKTLVNPNTNTGMKRIQEAFKQNTKNVIINGTDAGLTKKQAEEILSRAAGKYPNKKFPGKVEIWIKDGSVISK
ncbi:hypothetical protein KQI58_20610 [Enterococcus raffinosus]|uniref:CdiA C-terminal domain-containing protein n=1 Tax=Enterococcus raffinosus TaxID=71452 RepID=UPI001C117113|nr:pre-toxin TG domain-containing protein [Enterococcus raffinosus]MBU5363428.1 hypothetical protein [Enterococcus raffinosus]